jgi:hypothetical protein
MYLQEYQLRKVLALIAEKLPGALVIFDTVPSTGHDPQREVTIRPGVRARLAWFCDDPLQVEQWGLGYRLLDSRSIAELPPSVDRVLPFSLRYSLAVARVLGWKIDAYRLNVYRAEGLAAAVRRSPQP